MNSFAPPDLLADDRIAEFGVFIEANRRLVRLVETSMRETHGLPLVDFEAMMRLSRSPDRQLSMSELAGQMVLTPGGVTRLVDRLIDQGLVERASCPSDRRVQWAHLTDEGLRTVSEALVTHLDDLHEHYFSVMSPDERSIVAAVFDRLRANCGS